MKRFVAFARVSSREQQREGFSLAVQEDQLRAYAQRAGGTIVKMFTVAETASKTGERRVFQEMLAFAQAEAKKRGGLEGLLVYKVDRAARNLFDYVELERLEMDYGVKLIATSQETDDTPAGRMMRRQFANMATYFTEQMSEDICEGHKRRARDGHFSHRAPYGFRLERVDGRSVTVVDQRAAANVRRMFEIFATRPVTVEQLIELMHAEGREYRGTGRNATGGGGGGARFNKTRVHQWLRSRAYIGEVDYHGEWMPGLHEPLVDRDIWLRVQAKLAGRNYQSHQLVYGSETVRCGGCGRPVTGERKRKPSGREFVYYRCVRYNVAGHPGGRVRVREEDLDAQVLVVFRSIRLEDPAVAEWFRDELRKGAQLEQAEMVSRRQELADLQQRVATRRERLLQLRLDGLIENERFAQEDASLRDQAASVAQQLAAVSKGQGEAVEVALAVFELSQRLEKTWGTADFSVKRRLLDLVCLNRTLQGENLVIQLRKPFDLMAEGLVADANRGGGI